jgi:hypothetical protein
MCYNALINNKLVTTYLIPSDNVYESLELPEGNDIDMDLIHLFTSVKFINDAQKSYCMNMLMNMVMIYSSIKKIRDFIKM